MRVRKLEQAIIRSRIPVVDESLNLSLVRLVQFIRHLDLCIHPAVSETLDCARAMMLLPVEKLESALLDVTLNL